ncbi:MAG TPA: TusE/DsrC/DsvC family sulfur relay protein [Pseudomonadales bacterium]|nr:TusE/DsrC/DsvC family sulfur relay protein [Pseudomonadales bacterium]
MSAPAGDLPPLDADGYLLDLADWSDAVAQGLAAAEGVTLGSEHWQVIAVLRDFHDRYQLSPDNRAMVKAVSAALGKDRGRSIALMKLFGGSPAKTGARIAGLPKPTNCL